MIESIGTARGSLQNFEFYIGELVSRVRKMVQALEDWDGKGKRPHLPPAKNRKPNKPRPTGPGGKGTSAADAPAKTTWPSKNPSQQQVACYLAANAKKYGIPPTLPVVCALVESNLKNISYGDRDSVGLFQIRANMHPAPAGFGSASGKIQNASWWQAHPDAQMKWFANEAKRVSHGSGTDAATIGTWAANTERPAAEYRGRYQQRFSEAKAMVDKCAKMATPTATTNTPGGHNSGGSAGTKPPGGGTTPKPKSPGGQNSSGKTEAEKGLDKALAELKKNVRELNGNSNSGKEVNKYLGSTKTAIGSPWCAAFVHWCLSQAGFKFPGGGWASCETYQTEARKPNGSMFVVGHREARPGDLIVWGGEHIGIVESVKGGTIHYVAGNEGNAVARGTSSISASDYTIIRPRNQ